MRRTLITRTATITAALAAGLALSACSFEFSIGPNTNDRRDNPVCTDDSSAPECTDTGASADEDAAGADRDTGSASDDALTDPGSSRAADSAAGDDGAEDSAAGGSGTSTGGDTSQDSRRASDGSRSAGGDDQSGSEQSGSSGSGSGSAGSSGQTVTVPGHELAESVKSAAERQSGITGITVTCRDLRAYNVGSTTTCDMEMPSGKKYFPIVKVTSIEGTYVEYELEFPGVDF